jgi:hypothetical protein
MMVIVCDRLARTPKRTKIDTLLIKKPTVLPLEEAKDF